MARSSCRKRRRPNNWGSNFQDFNVRVGKVRQASTRSRQSRKKQRRNQSRPTLAPQTDGWHRVVSAIAVEEDIDNMADLTSNSVGNDSHADEADSDSDASQEVDTYQESDIRTIDCSDIYASLDHIEEEFDGETLDLSSLPEPQRANIERHDI